MKNICRSFLKQSLLMLFFSVSIFPLSAALASSEEATFESPLIKHGYCDPVPLKPKSEPVPSGQGIKCGDNRLSDYVSSCAKYCGSTGCGNTISCDKVPITCTKTREVCDGKNLDKLTCKKLGFFDGQLKCATSCESFDVTSCQICRGDSATKCYTAQLSKDLLMMFFGSNPEPTVIATADGISISWEYFDTEAGTSGIALVYVNRSGNIHFVDKKQMASFLGAKHPLLIADAGRLVLVARRDLQSRESELLVQEFDLAGDSLNEMFTIPGYAVSQLSWDENLLKIDTWNRHNAGAWIQYVDLKQKKVVVPPNLIVQKDHAKVAAPVGETQVRRLSALATNDLLAKRFKVSSGQHEFEGALLNSSKIGSLPSWKSPKAFPVIVESGKLVVAIRKIKN